MTDLRKEKLKELLMKDASLRSFGFSFASEKVEKSKVLHDAYVFTFLNKKVNRTLDFSIRNTASSNDSFLSVYIFNEKNESLSIEDYLSKHKLYQERDYFRLSTYPGDSSEKVTRFFGFIISIITNNIREIITGEKWENIPFDWHGYK